MYLERAIAIREKAIELDEKEKREGRFEEEASYVGLVDMAFESFLKYFLVRVKFEVETKIQYMIDNAIMLEDRSKYMLAKELERTSSHNAAITMMVALNRFAKANNLPLFYDGPVVDTSKMHQLNLEKKVITDVEEKAKRSKMTDALFEFLREADLADINKVRGINDISDKIKQERKDRAQKGVEIVIPEGDEGSALKVAAFNNEERWAESPSAFITEFENKGERISHGRATFLSNEELRNFYNTSPADELIQAIGKDKKEGKSRSKKEDRGEER